MPDKPDLQSKGMRSAQDNAAAQKRRKVFEAKLALDDAVKLAQVGRLCGCSAQGVPLPCKHAIAASKDPALREWMRQAIRGMDDGLALAETALVLEADDVSYEDYRPSYRPDAAIRISADKERRLGALRERVKRGHACDHPGDFFGEVCDDDDD